MQIVYPNPKRTKRNSTNPNPDTTMKNIVRIYGNIYMSLTVLLTLQISKQKSSSGRIFVAKSKNPKEKEHEKCNTSSGTYEISFGWKAREELRPQFVNFGNDDVFLL